MPNYIFWPYESFFEKSGAEGTQVALAISFQETHFVVLGVCSSKQLENVIIRPPYSILATREFGENDWDYKVSEPCNVHFRIPRLKYMQFYSSDPISLIIPEKAVDLQSSVGETLNFTKLEEHPRYMSDNKKLRETLNIINLFPTYSKSLSDLYPFVQTSHENLRDNIFSAFSTWYSSTYVHQLSTTLCGYITLLICSIAS